jgi:hypothetical protein
MAIRFPACLGAAFGLVFLLATGCNSTQSSLNQSVNSISGNWAFTTAASQSAPTPLTLNAGFTQGSDQAVSAVAHLSGSACISTTTSIALSGSIGANNQLVLTSKPFGGTTLSLKGQLATGGKAISDATWSFSGGSCAKLGTAAVKATDYSQISGTYSGNFVDADNNQLAISATLTQTTQPDENGQYHLSGSATFPGNPCFTQPIVTDSLVTGNSVSTTYSQGSASITAVGTLNSAATQLTVTSWTVAGGLCDGDSGTGLLATAQ